MDTLLVQPFPVLILLYNAGWMDTLCGSTCATKSCILKLTETGTDLNPRGGSNMKRLGMLVAKFELNS